MIVFKFGNYMLTNFMHTVIHPGHQTHMAESNMLGTLDILVIGGVVGLALYYFVFRKPKKEMPQFKKLTVGYVTSTNNVL